MCTLTLHKALKDGENSVIATFNRDEQKLRPNEIAPEIFNINENIRAIYPLDSKANGTWIAVNSFGLMFFILNAYDNINYVPKQSRGFVIKQILHLSSIKELKDFLNKHSFSNLAPFKLVMFYKNEILTLDWNGKEKIFHLDFFKNLPITISSSSLNTNEVLDYRQDLLKKWTKEGCKYSENGIPKHHLSSNKPEFDILVKRKEVETKSICQINIGSVESLIFV
jgi:hypothetical protein